MKIKLICPTKTVESAKKARELLIYQIYESRKLGLAESRWMIAEMVTRFFVCFGIGYCICCDAALIGFNTIHSVFIAIIFSILGIVLSLRLPFFSVTRNIMLHSNLIDTFRTLNAIIVALETISSIMKESPSMILTEEGERAEIIENDYGNITIETTNHRYFFPKASKYMNFSDDFRGLVTISFQSADSIIEDICP